MGFFKKLVALPAMIAVGVVGLMSAAPANAGTIDFDLNQFEIGNIAYDSTSGLGSFDFSTVVGQTAIVNSRVHELSTGLPDILTSVVGSFTFSTTPGTPVPTTGSVSGSFTLTDANGDSYSVASADGGFLLTSVPGVSPDRYVFSLITSGGSFSDVTGFAGIDLSPFTFPNGALAGSFLNFELTQQDFANGSAVTDANISVVIPTPSAALGGLAMIGLVGARRMRRF